MTTSIGEARYGSPKTVSPDWLRAEYDGEADTWDQTLAKLSFDGAYRQVLDEEEWPNPRRHVRILDVGIGSGATTLAMIDALRRRGITVGQVTGVDISERMLERAKKNIEPTGLDVRTILADVERLPFDHHEFDYVLAAHVLEHLPRPLRGMAEIERVLRPGGSAVFMMTRCAPVTLSIRKRWSVQCVRSRKLEAVLNDFGFEHIRCKNYPHSLMANLLSFCCIASTPYKTT